MAERHESQYCHQDPEGGPTDPLPVGQRHREKDHDQRRHRGDLPDFGDEGPGRRQDHGRQRDTEEKNPAPGRHPFAALEAVINRVAVSCDCRQTGRKGPRAEWISLGDQERSDGCCDDPFQSVADVHHDGRSSAQGSHDVGSTRIAAADFVNIDPVHTGYEDREVDASDEVGGDQCAHHDCRIHQTQSRGGSVVPGLWNCRKAPGVRITTVPLDPW